MIVISNWSGGPTGHSQERCLGALGSLRALRARSAGASVPEMSQKHARDRTYEDAHGGRAREAGTLGRTGPHCRVPTSADPGLRSRTMTDNLWLHFSQQGPGFAPPVIARGEGVTIYDDRGKPYLDGLSGLFTVQVGHGRTELAQVAARQAETLAFFPLWGYATPTAIELAERIAGYTPVT